MAHEIYEHDSGFVCINKAWHDRLPVMPTYPESIEQAKDWSKIRYRLSVNPMFHLNTAGEYNVIPDNFVVVRDDIQLPVGTCKGRFIPLQPSEVFEFTGKIIDVTGGVIDTCFTMFNSKKMVVCLKMATTEYVNGDPVDRFLLIHNGHGANHVFGVADTDIRVVCNNTYQLALQGSQNQVSFKHTESLNSNMDAVLKTIQAYHKHKENVDRVMSALAKTPMPEVKQNDFIENVLFPAKKRVVKNRADMLFSDILNDSIIPSDSVASEQAELSKTGETRRRKTIDLFKEILETGKGTDIKGVRGTAYGMLNGITEYSDHYSISAQREGVDASHKIESRLFGSGNLFKQESAKKLFQYVELAA